VKVLSRLNVNADLARASEVWDRQVQINHDIAQRMVASYEKKYERQTGKKVNVQPGTPIHAYMRVVARNVPIARTPIALFVLSLQGIAS
jgi:hypothetical protein